MYTSTHMYIYTSRQTDAALTHRLKGYIWHMWEKKHNPMERSSVWGSVAGVLQRDNNDVLLCNISTVRIDGDD